MPSTYTSNVLIEKIGIGEQAGQWGTTTNINFDIIDEAINGAVAVNITSAQTSGSPNILLIDEGALSDGRNFSIELTGSPGGSAFIRLDPNTAEKIGYIKNSFGDGSSAIIFQGTYNSSRDYVLAASYGAFLKFDGVGSGATVTNLLQNHVVDGTLLAGNVTVGSGGTLDATGATVDVSGGTLTLADNQISGNKIDGGVISNFASTGIDDNASSTALTIDSSGNIAVTGTVDGRDIASDGSKLDGIAPGAEVNVGTNLGRSVSGTGFTLTSSTGNNTTLPAATTSAWGVMTDEDKTKLDGIAPGAQVNVGTNITVSEGATTVAINSSTGSDDSIAAATTSAAGVMTATDKSKLNGIADNANNYSLPKATSTVRGGVELGSDTVQSVAANSPSTSAGKTYPIQLNSANQMVVNVPWADTTNPGTVTSIATGTGIAGGTITTSGTISLNFAELTDMTADISGSTEFILQNGTTESRKAASEIKLSNFNNDSGWTSNVGDITGVTAGLGLAGGGSSGSVTLSVDLSELTDMTATMVGTDEFIVLDAGADRRKAANEIGLSIFNNDSGFTANAGDITNVGAGNGLTGGGASGSVTLNVGAGALIDVSADAVAVDLSELTDMTAAMVNTDEFVVLDASAQRRKAASEIGLSIFNNDSGFTTNVGDITNVTAGNGLSGGGASGSVSLAFDGNELTTGTAGNADFFVVVGDDGTSRKVADSNINISTLNNDSGFTTNVGDITGVTAGVGLAGGGTSGSVTLTLDMSELTDMTAAMVGTDEFIVLDAGADRRKAASEIGLSIFNNDSGFTTNVGDITGVTAGNGLYGGGTSGTVTVNKYATITNGGTVTMGDGGFRTVTSNNQIITLPNSPAAGDTVYISVGDFTNTTVAKNGSRIMGLDENLIIDVANIGITLIYSNSATLGWRLM